MKLIIILLSYSGTDKIISRISEIVKKDDCLFVEGVVIEEISPSFSSLISDLGFLGDKVVNDVREAVGKIYRENAGRHLNEIEERFSKQGINVFTEKITDDNLEIIDKILNNKDIDKIIINYTNNEYIIRSAVDNRVKDFLARNDIPVEIYYDGSK